CFVQERAASVLDVTEVDDNVVVVDGASKAFAMTGWRVGFSYSTRPLASAMAAMQSHITSNISTPSQYAALAAYRDEPRFGRGVRVDGVRMRRSVALMRMLREETAVAAVPGPAFGEARSIRLTLDAPEAATAEGLCGMASPLSNTPAGRSS